MTVLEINFWVWSSTGPVGLKFTGPSLELLITLIILKFFRSDPQGVLHVFPILEFSTKLAEYFVFLSVQPQPFAFVLPCHLELACFFFLAGAGVSDAVLISLSSDDCFPPKEEYNEPYTCFHFDILWLTF